LTPPKKTPEWLLFLSEFVGMFPIMLEVAGILCFVAYILHPDSQSEVLAFFQKKCLKLYTVVFGYSIVARSHSELSFQLLSGTLLYSDT
jgi:hypothetical protein